MLRNLFIQNYALIDNLEIEFFKGLNIITGETGAGKSILLGALGLILGNRADTNVLKDKEKGCVVEGTFDISAYDLKDFFVENDIDYQDQTIIRRVVSPVGKSRAFVNEIPVTLNLLKDLVGKIIDIHSQHENLLLSDGNFQLSVIDSFTENSNSVAQYKDLFRRYKTLSVELGELKERALQAKADLEYLQFQLNQLEDAKLIAGEDDELQGLQQQLAHAEEIKSSLKIASEYLNSDDRSILIWLKDTEALLSKIANFFPSGKELAERVEACRIELKDIAREVELQVEKVDIDPRQLESINNRLDLLLNLQQKHRVESVEELINLREKFKNQVDEISNYDLVVDRIAKELELVTDQAFSLAKSISTVRRNGSEKLEISIKDLLVQMGMPFAGFKVDFIQQTELLPAGIDKVSFQFTANKQMPLQDLSRVASGGELSRLMLSLKSLLVKSKGLPTVILDEIDTGVSGEVADKVGNIIYKMAQGMQVINITHLPQIASKGNRHFLVFKDNDQENSKTQIKLLTSEERIVEVAKMLSGEKISDAALVNAKHLLSNGLDYE